MAVRKEIDMIKARAKDTPPTLVPAAGTSSPISPHLQTGTTTSTAMPQYSTAIEFPNHAGHVYQMPVIPHGLSDIRSTIDTDGMHILAPTPQSTMPQNPPLPLSFSAHMGTQASDPPPSRLIPQATLHAPYNSPPPVFGHPLLPQPLFPAQYIGHRPVSSQTWHAHMPSPRLSANTDPAFLGSWPTHQDHSELNTHTAVRPGPSGAPTNAPQHPSYE